MSNASVPAHDSDGPDAPSEPPSDPSVPPSDAPPSPGSSPSGRPTTGPASSTPGSKLPPSPIADALSTLSDRGLRRLLGARTFLRGLDYARRRVVEEVQIGQAGAVGKVRGSDSDPYIVRVDLAPEGIQSNCTCPAFLISFC